MVILILSITGNTCRGSAGARRSLPSCYRAAGSVRAPPQERLTGTAGSGRATRHSMDEGFRQVGSAPAEPDGQRRSAFEAHVYF